MPPHELVQAFTPEVRAVFEAFLNALCTINRNFMNATKQAQYLSFLADPEQKITEKNKTENKRLHAEERRAIKEFCVDSCRQLLHVAQKKEKITKPQVLFAMFLTILDGYILQVVTIVIRRLFNE